MIHAFAVTDPGRRRRNNEDRLLTRAALGLFVVADGMGGHQGGEEASRQVTRFFQETDPTSELTALQYLQDGFEQINRRILAQAYRERHLEGMGSTATALLFDPHYYNLLQIGDSRAYLYRDGRLEQMTRDDTLIQTWLDAEQITPAEAEYHPQRNQLTQALGREGVVFQPCRGLRRDGDIWLLCSDGLSGVLDDAELAEGIRRLHRSPEQLCRHLVDRANERGGPDNISVIIAIDALRSRPEPEPRAPLSLSSATASPCPTGSADPEHQGEDAEHTMPDTPLFPAPIPAGEPHLPATLPDQAIDLDALVEAAQPGHRPARSRRERLRSSGSRRSRL